MPGVHDPLKVAEAQGTLRGGCGLCDNQTGPFTTANVELPGIGLFYLCARCIRLHARAIGMDAGDEQAALLHSVEEATKLRKQLDRVGKQRAKLLEERVENCKLIGEQADALGQRDGRIKQLEEAIRAKAEADFALVAE